MDFISMIKQLFETSEQTHARNMNELHIRQITTLLSTILTDDHRDEFSHTLSSMFIDNALHIIKYSLLIHTTIDDLQIWLIQEAAKYEKRINEIIKERVYNIEEEKYSIRPHLETSDKELSLYRKNLFEILL